MRYEVPKGGGRLIVSGVDHAKLQHWFRVIRANGKVETHICNHDAGEGEHVITELHEGDKVETIRAPLFGSINITFDRPID